MNQIPNHFAARLSSLDMQMVKSVPEGGNWKDIPPSIPSKRLDQIRASFARGEGSRSTYYGRLRRLSPSYTINTYFSRPGNGCHIHYEQDRVLSQREAARLQSFPDNFEFFGSQTAINTQIGNAVPPLLAYQIALALPHKGIFLDLFAGAGGLGLGFKWAGWSPFIANDIDGTFLSTYAHNVHEHIVQGSLSDSIVQTTLMEAAKKARALGKPLWVLGGPPCQGFSTAGNQRSMNDARNHLVWDYARFLEKVRPDGFVFENVPGLLSMERGHVFAAVCEALARVMPNLSHALLAADDYAVPQKRKRLLLVGQRQNDLWVPPAPITSSEQRSLFSELAPAISVEEAISDLPKLDPGQDGSHLQYRHSPSTAYQALMRGTMSPSEYLAAVRSVEKIHRAAQAPA